MPPFWGTEKKGEKGGGYGDVLEGREERNKERRSERVREEGYLSFFKDLK